MLTKNYPVPFGAGRLLPRRKKIFESVVGAQPLVIATYPSSSHPKVYFLDFIVFLRELAIIWKRITSLKIFKLKEKIYLGIFLTLTLSLANLYTESKIANAGFAITKEGDQNNFYISQPVIEKAPIISWPLEKHISQYFTSYHPGIDLTAPYGTEIKPLGEGKVVEVGYQLGYGRSVLIKHNEELFSFYAHLSKINVKEGDLVEEKSVIGNIGTTGWSTGPHLHLEVFDKDKAFNPLKILP